MRLIAVGTRMPTWVSAGCDEYLKRLRPALRVDIVELTPGVRPAGAPVERAMEDEARRMLGRLAKDEYVITLDERGKVFSSVELSRWLAERMRDGRDLAFLIGGPDGFAPAVRERADLDWSLSRLTLPHALVRVVLAEQLYRAHSLLAGHPYHRA